MLTDNYDVIVVGGGAAAVHAAYPLVMAGIKVAMVDGGITRKKKQKSESRGFESFRKEALDQHELFLGDDFSGLNIAIKTHADSMITGNKAYVASKTKEWLPVKTRGLDIFQSLAKGGLGECWSGVCEILDDEELTALGIPSDEMRENYKKVIKRVGVSGEKLGYDLQPPAAVDVHGQSIINQYRKKKDRLDSLGLVISHPTLGVITKDKDNRKAIAYKDMEFWSDFGKSIYRPSYTIDQLKRYGNFSYIPNRVVKRIIEKDNLIEIESFSISDSNNSPNKVSYYAKYVIIAAGSINTTRILLRSFNLYDKKAPFLTKSNTLIPCINFSVFPKIGNKKRHSLCQAVIFEKVREKGLIQYYTQIHSYKSLLLFKLVNYLPLPKPEAMFLLSIFTPFFAIVNMRVSSFMNDDSYCILKKKKDGSDYLNIYFKENGKISLKNFLRGLRMLRMLPTRFAKFPPGSTSHYAGGVPISKEDKERYPVSVDSNGKLHQGRKIYIADSSMWRALPSKPLMLTIMANANRIGEHVRDLFL